MKIRRIDFYADDFLVGVAELSAVEIGVYWLLCSLIYSSGGPIPNQDGRLLKLSGLRKDHLERVMQRLILCAKVTRNECVTDVERCSSELERAAKRISRATENGAKGNNSKRLRSAGAKRASTLTYNIQHTTRENTVGLEGPTDANHGTIDAHERVYVHLLDGPILKIGPSGMVDVAYEPRDYQERLEFTAGEAIKMRSAALRGASDNG